MNKVVDLDERGHQLRSDILALYSTMQSSKTLRARPHINDISDFIRKHLPDGISFDDAEHILRCAGFEVLGRPDINVPDDPNWGKRDDKYDVIATMSFPKRFISRAELMLGMRPQSPGDYSTVNEIRAAIIVTHL